MLNKLKYERGVLSLGYDKYISFRREQNHVICELNSNLKRGYKSTKDILEVDNFINKKKMIVSPISADSKHCDVVGGTHVYRYGYRSIEGDEKQVFAAVEEFRKRLSEVQIHAKVSSYCESVGIADEYKASDYGY